MSKNPKNWGKLWTCFKRWTVKDENYELWFKRHIQKSTLSHVLILIVTSQICWIMGWLKIQKLEWISWEQDETFLQNKIIISLCLRSHILTSYLFVAELTFKETFEKIKVSNITYMDLILITNTEESITEWSKIRWKEATWNQWEN